ncbi:MAG: S8 family serine peptidase [Deltaproteobacteria bacterium]
MAIIDSGCRLDIPRLKKRVDQFKSFVPGGADKDPIGHGTAVALLISEVAPDARLDIYNVVRRDGDMDQHTIAHAIREASRTDADVINLSLGVPRSLELTRIDPDQLADILEMEWFKFKELYLTEKPQCDLCNAATEACDTGKLVFAAAGEIKDTKTNTVFCPARSTPVTGVGFVGQGESTLHSTSDGGLKNSITAPLPLPGQVPLFDVPVEQIPAVVGTSFACPLYAGVGALGLAKGELEDYIKSMHYSASPMRLHNNSHYVALSPSQVKSTFQAYDKALYYVPHVHCTVQAKLHPGTAITDPSGCATCGFFVEPQFVNQGLWLLERNQIDDGISLLEVARSIAPWSANAAANLGAAHREKAIDLYEIAVKLSSGNPVFVDALKRLR